jgi:multiple sugar transport system permease protein
MFRGIKRMGRLERKEAIAGLLLISPWIVGFIVFLAGPIVFSIAISLTKWDVFRPPTFIGLGNYVNMFKDSLFWQALKVTLIYVIFSVPLLLIVALMIAMLMNQKIKGITVFRTVYYLPSVIAGVVAALVWQWLFNADFGLINYFLYKAFRINGPNWLFSETWALPALILMSLWGVGSNMVIYLAGLQNIPTELYEAASIDGANVFRKFWHITVPMISPIIFFNLIMGIIGSFQVFTQSYVMTRGGPNNATLFYVLYLYRQAFRYFNMSYGTSLAWFLFLIILVFTLITFKSSSVWVYYEGEVKRR